MSSFSNVKLKYRIPIRVYFCARKRDPTTLMMLSLIQRVIRHALIISRQGIGIGKRLNIVTLNSKVGSKGVVAPLTKNLNPKADIVQFFLESLAGTVRNIFITNVLSRNNAIVRPVWQKFGNRGPFFGLVGIGLATGGKTLTEDYEFETVCSEIRNALELKEEQSQSDFNVEDVELKLQSSRYIGKGQNGAIYQIHLNSEDLAVKVMFNFDLQSNASTILRGMIRELVPIHSKQKIQGIDLGDMKRCPSHPNIVDIKNVLTSRNILLPGALEHWPHALPSNFNGYGRNMTMYIVMQLYDADLENYLRNTELKSRERILILAQMLEGISHLKTHGIAHRDIKSNNFLVKVMDYPHVVITDFGHCLASIKTPLQLPYPTEDMEIGGNPALLAPELVCTKPGTFRWLNYEHSDTWAVGAIAYELFGQLNPFYTELTSKYYDEDDLPRLENAPSIIERVVRGLLKRNPRERLSCELAATICYVFLWGPRNWLQKKEGREKAIGDVEILHWLMLLTSKVIWNKSCQSEMNLIHTFLKRVNYSDVQKAVRFCQQ